MDGYSLVDSLGVKSGAKGGSSSEISGGKLEGAELGDSGTEIFYPGKMQDGNGDVKIDGSPLREKYLFG